MMIILRWISSPLLFCIPLFSQTTLLCIVSIMGPVWFSISFASFWMVVGKRGRETNCERRGRRVLKRLKEHLNLVFFPHLLLLHSFACFLFSSLSLLPSSSTYNIVLITLLFFSHLKRLPLPSQAMFSNVQREPALMMNSLILLSLLRQPRGKGATFLPSTKLWSSFSFRRKPLNWTLSLSSGWSSEEMERHRHLSITLFFS